MAHRVFRFSVSPETAPEVRRVVELDGRATLTQLHEAIGRAFGMPPSGAGYMFFLSGRFWDGASMFVDPRADGRRADKAMLFRLGLEPGRQIAYVLGFEVERHFLAELVSVVESAKPLPAAVVIEAVGEVPTQPLAEDSSQDDEAPAELARVAPLAETFLDLHDQLDELDEELSRARTWADPWQGDLDSVQGLAAGEARANEPDLARSRQARPAFRAAAAAALELARGLGGSVRRFYELDEWLLERALAQRLLDLPALLTQVQELDLALELARALAFIDPDAMNGAVAITLARAGRGEEALAQLEKNLTAPRDAVLAEISAGDAHRALGDGAAAEAYYRAALAASKTPTDRLQSLLRLATCLTEAGRTAEAVELLREAQRARGEPAPQAEPVPRAVGRNDPCPCGSGKKYKKCHGQ